MATIVYLDVDDEITSAAARMRASAEGGVGLVVPYGSRLATSRINFRLLAREARSRGRDLTIVAGDAATRALAASAGLAVYATVGEYEAALEAASNGSSGAPADAAGPPPPAEASAAGSPGTAVPETPVPETPARERASRGRRARTPDPDLEQTAVIATPAPIITAPSPVRAPGGPAEAAPAAAGPADAERQRTTAARSLPVAAGRRFRPPRAAVLAVAAALALALLVVGVGAYVFLPSATIAITPREESLGPVEITVRADPESTGVDPAAGVVPAERLTIELEASDTFPASGRRVEQSAARGQVTFQNFDPTSSNAVPAGSIVSTEGGVQFRTLTAVELPPGQFVIPEVVPSSRDVGVEAVEPGPGGNVAANTITAVPRGENPIFLRVTNKEATSGGARREFPQVTRSDVDAAEEQLSRQLGQQFEERLRDPATVPPGMTLFPETRSLREATTTVDPATLVGQEVETFELAMTASGTVVAVDESPLEELGISRIRGAVDADHLLVEGSIEVEVGEPSVDAEQVSFPVAVRARQVRVVDGEALREAIKGRSVPEARSILEQYGDVEISVWPDWVTAVPTLDQRVSLTVESPSPPSLSPSPARSPSASPSPAGNEPSATPASS